MVITNDLKSGQSLPAPMVVEVTDVDWDPGNSRRAIVSLIDAAGNELGLIDYEGANINIGWQVDYRYQISRCGVQNGGRQFKFELAPSSKTVVEPLGPKSNATQLLVIGDTHIGRTEHPGTGEPIDPVEAFSTAVSFGIEQSVNAVIHAGDIFHENATVSQAKRVNRDIFEPLTKANIPFYYVRGNHEATAGNEILTQRDGSLATNLDASGAAIGSDICLYGIDHYERGDRSWSPTEFPSATSESIAVLILHQALEQVSGPGPKTVDLNGFDQSVGQRFDIVFTGHQHDARRTDWNGIPIIYTGASERMSTNQDATDRVAWLVTIENGNVTCEKYPIP